MGGDASFDTPNEDYYLSHWSKVYREDSSQLDREWHCGYDEALAAVLPFVNRASAGAARRDDAGDDAGAASTSGNNNTDGDGDDNIKVSANNHGLVVDVGCGSSSMGHTLWNDFSFGHLVLTDVDPGILRTMHERFGTDGDGETVDLKIVFHPCRLHIGAVAVEFLHHPFGHGRACRVVIATKQDRRGEIDAHRCLRTRSGERISA